MNSLPTVRAAELAAAPPSAQTWLVEGLWSAEAVGIIGGEPKCCKSFLALDLAVAVASGTPCLRRFPAGQRGPVLLFAAEDAAHIVRQRLEGIAAAAAVDFQTLDVHLITAPALRLDHHDDREALAATIARLQPKLLVLDPFVRLHCIDENAAAEVAPLLAYLRTLQRRHHTAVALVHHARKGAAHERGGQALRGSSEFHAWGDSNLYMRRIAEQLQLSIEHRAAPGRDWLPLALKEEPPALEVVDQQSASTSAQPSCRDRIEKVLIEAAGEPLSLKKIRDRVRMRTSDVSQALGALVASGSVIKSATGYQPREAGRE
jgi:RecA-family ATPase